MPGATGAGDRGPERPTVFERLVGLLPLPYGAAAAVLLLLTSPVPLLLAGWADTGDPWRWFASLEVARVPIWRWAATSSIFLGAVYLVFHLIRRLRLRVVQTIPQCAALLPGGERQCRALFAPVSHPGAALVAALLVTLAFLPTVATYPAVFGTGAQLVFAYWQAGVWFLAYGTLSWVYFGALWGLHRIGRQELRLPPPGEDRMLGMRPLGALSLSLVRGYFLVLILFIVLQIVDPSPAPGTTALLLGLTAFGAVMFFLPLRSLHRRMRAEKDRRLAPLRRDLVARAVDAGTPGPGGEATLADVRDLLGEVRRTLAVEAAERQIAASPTWPFDTAILGRFAAILTGVFVSVLAQYVIVQIGL